MSAALEELLMQVEDMQLLPAQAVRVRRVADDRRSSLDDLEAVVAQDPALAASILRLANSAFFGLRRRVGSLREGLFVLGFAATRDLALALALSALGKSEHPLRAALWRQAMRGAAAARAIASCTYGEIGASEAFVAGLLRDIGRILLLELDGEHYPTLEGGGAELIAAERATYGTDHAELGAACLERWGLPAATCAAVGGHHGPVGGGRLGVLVALADAVEIGAPELRESSYAATLELKETWLEHAQRAMVTAGGAFLMAA